MEQANQIQSDGTKIVPVHFEQAGRIACAPGMEVLSASENRPHPFQRTDEPRAVTCKACLASGAYKAAEQYMRAMLAKGVTKQ